MADLVKWAEVVRQLRECQAAGQAVQRATDELTAVMRRLQAPR